MQKCVAFFPEKEDERIFVYVLEFMLTRILRVEHFESYSNFSYCTHSSVYRVFWPKSRGSK